MRTISALAAALALAAGLSGCIMLPPPPQAHRPPPPNGPPPRPGEAMPPFAYRGPPPEALELCAGKPEGARFEMPGRRGDMLAGTCERGPDGRLVPRPDGARP